METIGLLPVRGRHAFDWASVHEPISAKEHDAFYCITVFLHRLSSARIALMIYYASMSSA